MSDSMANKQQTAVQFLIERFNNYDITTGKAYFKKLLNQALQIEREQIEKAFDEGQEYEYQYHVNSTPKFDSGTYYVETYAD